MNSTGWPIRWFNLYAASAAIAAAALDSVWLSLAVTAPAGSVVAWLMVRRWLAGLEQQLDAKTWQQARAQDSGRGDHAPFLVIQALFGAFIQVMWTLLATGIFHVIHDHA